MKIVLIVLSVLALLAVGLLGHRRLVMGPANVGVYDGRLGACPHSPNCVSTFAQDGDHRVEPISFDGDPADALARLRRLIEATPRTQVVDADDRYLHAEAKSLVWGYVDDLEVLVDADVKQIHFRSASRTGYSDLGVNRRRVRRLVERYR